MLQSEESVMHRLQKYLSKRIYPGFETQDRRDKKSKTGV